LAKEQAIPAVSEETKFRRENIPPMFLNDLTAKLNNKIVEYATQQLGEEEYERQVNATPNDNEALPVDAIATDFTEGFWYAFEVLNVQFAQPQESEQVQENTA